MKRSPIKRGGPIAKTNPARRKRLYAEQFSDKADFIRRCRCVVADYARLWPGADSIECEGPIEAAHSRSRGAGGKAADTLPLCRKHHLDQHALGVKTFQDAYGFSLHMAAALYQALYELERE